MQTFLKAYLECALWSSTDANNHDRPFDERFSIADFDEESLEIAKKDCEAFLEKAGKFITPYELTQAGHDFWLTRNRHGCGFWDGDWGDKKGEVLTKIANSFGELYVDSINDEKVCFV